MEGGRGETNKTIEEAIKKRQPSGAIWSPDSSKFTLVRYDEREVADLWVVHAVGNERPELESAFININMMILMMDKDDSEGIK